MNISSQQNLMEFKVRIAKARRKYLVEAMEYRKRQLKNKKQEKK